MKPSFSVTAGLVAALLAVGGCGWTTAKSVDGGQAGSVVTTATASVAPAAEVGEDVRTADWKVAVRRVVDPFVEAAHPWDEDGFNMPGLPRPLLGEHYIRLDFEATNMKGASQRFPEGNLEIEDGIESWGPEGSNAPWDGSTAFPPVAPGETVTHRYYFAVPDEAPTLAVTFKPIRLTGPKVRIAIR